MLPLMFRRDAETDTDMFKRFTHRIVLLTTHFRYPNRTLLFARARLFMDRIELTGWTASQKYRLRLALDQIVDIVWENLSGKHGTAVFHLREQGPVAVEFSQPRLWQRTLQERLRWYQTAPEKSSPEPHLHRMPLRDFVACTTSMT